VRETEGKCQSGKMKKTEIEGRWEERKGKEIQSGKRQMGIQKNTVERQEEMLGKT
jgi:hypothetical protein